MASQNQLPKKWKYDAFLNFNPEDFEGSFVADLYKRLEDKGINAFERDSVKLQKGETISTEILEAIEESRIAITIFSKNYVSSPWCLEELTKIMDCVAMGQEFFVVFYRTSAATTMKNVVIKLLTSFVRLVALQKISWESDLA
ncbi:toll/interleukin-1 receptor-like protein [Lycium ferocissimum]|uniref:toll/interleukin-1 receptor-like protein n=1 Tax=Lycium ferocissimum TaxID=112874 RepID=UPI0028152A7D|nr:toll/interleukin-1 receptor-like protein [Lycium ferocissimum]